jgi:hypothetical protein
MLVYWKWAKKDVLSPDCLFLRTFCPSGCFVPTDVWSSGCFVSPGIFPSLRFVPPDVLSHGHVSGHFGPPDVLSGNRKYCLYKCTVVLYTYLLTVVHETNVNIIFIHERWERFCEIGRRDIESSCASTKRQSNFSKAEYIMNNFVQLNTKNVYKRNCLVLNTLYNNCLVTITCDQTVMFTDTLITVSK